MANQVLTIKDAPYKADEEIKKHLSELCLTLSESELKYAIVYMYNELNLREYTNREDKPTYEERITSHCRC